jgi:hypothetical protein
MPPMPPTPLPAPPPIPVLPPPLVVVEAEPPDPPEPPVPAGPEPPAPVVELVVPTVVSPEPPAPDVVVADPVVGLPVTVELVTPLPPAPFGAAGQSPGGSGCGLSGQFSVVHAVSHAPSASVPTSGDHRLRGMTLALACTRPGPIQLVGAIRRGGADRSWHTLSQVRHAGPGTLGNAGTGTCTFTAFFGDQLPSWMRRPAIPESGDTSLTSDPSM